MHLRLVLILGTFIWSSVCEAQEDRQSHLQNTISQHIHLLEKALQNQDTTQLNQLLHPQLTLGHSNGWIENKESLKTDLIRGFVTYQQFVSVGDVDHHLVSDYLIITRRNVDVHGTYDGYPFVSHLQIMEIWTYHNQQWWLTARQSVNRKK
jgi:hypothetical protein